MAFVVDSHAHAIAPDNDAYPLTSMGGPLEDRARGVLTRRIDAEQLLALMRGAGVARAAVVQFAHIHGYDNRYVVDAARAHPSLLGAVCCVDASAPDVGETLRRWAEAGAEGVRVAPPLPNTVASDWLDNPGLWRTAGELDMTLCVCVPRAKPGEALRALDGLMGVYPEVDVLLDHVGFPIVRADAPEFGLADVLRLAGRERLFVKVTTVNLDDLEAAGVAPAPFMDLVVEAFGAARITWGSDVPNAPGDYGDMLERMRRAFMRHSEADLQAIFGGTAIRLYPARGRG